MRNWSTGQRPSAWPFTGKRLPSTFDDLIRIGVALDVMDELKKFVDAGHAEHDVVRAYLEALAERARESRVSRKLVSRLRDQFNTSEECKELRAAVVALSHLRASQPSRVPAH